MQAKQLILTIQNPKATYRNQALFRLQVQIHPIKLFFVNFSVQVFHCFQNYNKSKRLEKDFNQMKPKKPRSKWTGYEQQRYLLFFMANRQKFAVKRVSRSTYLQLSDFIGNTKTIDQCQDFNSSMKRLGSFDKMVQKIKKKVNLNSDAMHLLSLKIKNQKQQKINSLFKEFKNDSSIKRQGIKRLKQTLNPFQIVLNLQNQRFNQKYLQFVFKSIVDSQVNSHKINSQKPFESFNQTVYEQKIIQQIQEQVVNQQSLIGVQKQQKKGFGSWTNKQKLRYLLFLMKYKQNLAIKDISCRQAGIFKKMSRYIQSRRRLQCSNFHIHNMKKNQSIQDLISYFQNSIPLNQAQIRDEIKRIQNFYKDDFQKQLNALQENICTLVNPKKNQLQKISQMIGVQLRNYYHRKSLIEKNILFENQITPKQSIEIQIPILIKLIFQKQIEESKNIQQKYPTIVQQILKINGNNKHQIHDQNFIQSSEVDQNSISNFQQRSEIQAQNSKKQSSFWTVGENIKLATFLLINREYFQLNHTKIAPFAINKLKQYIGQSKSFIQCSKHIWNWKKYYNLNMSQMITQETKRFGVTQQLIQQRRVACSKVRHFEFNFNNFKIQFDTFAVKQQNSEDVFDFDFAIKNIFNMKIPIKAKLKLVEQQGQKRNQEKYEVQQNNQLQSKYHDDGNQWFKKKVKISRKNEDTLCSVLKTKIPCHIFNFIVKQLSTKNRTTDLNVIQIGNQEIIVQAIIYQPLMISLQKKSVNN